MSAFRPVTRLLPRTQRRNLARMTLIGRLAAQPEMIQTANGRDLARYTLAVSTGTRDNPETSFFRVSAFPSTDALKSLFADLQKGQQMFVEADGKLSKYQVDGSSENRTRFELIQRNFELLQRPAESRADLSAGAAAAASHGAEAGDEAVR